MLDLFFSIAFYCKAHAGNCFLREVSPTKTEVTICGIESAGKDQRYHYIVGNVDSQIAKEVHIRFDCEDS